MARGPLLFLGSLWILKKNLPRIITAEYSLLLLNTSSNNRVIGIRVSFCQPDRCPSGSRKMISPGQIRKLLEDNTESGGQWHHEHLANFPPYISVLRRFSFRKSEINFFPKFIPMQELFAIMSQARGTTYLVRSFKLLHGGARVFPLNWLSQQ